MGNKISNTTKYPNQSPVSDDDFLIGTDATNGSTKTFKVSDLIQQTFDENNIVYITSADSPYTVPLSGKLISCDTTGGDITVKLPTSPGEGFSCQIINYEGGNNVTITTVSGAVNIGDATSQVIRRDTGAISVKFQTSSGRSEYLITQDSRNALTNRITVTKASDLSGSLDSTKEYFIDGRVNMGSQTISIPTGGITITGYGFDKSILYSSADNYTMFNGGSSDDLFITSLTLTASGTSSKVFNVDNSYDGTKAIELNTVNFSSCTEIGDITGYRQGLLRNIGIFSCSQGFTFNGSWSGGVRIETCIVRDSSGTFFNEGTDLNFGSRFFSNANLSVPSGSIGYRFTNGVFGNDGDYQLQGGEFSGNGTYTSGIDNTSINSRWRNNSGILDTYVGADITVSSASSTTITADNIEFKLNSPFNASGLVWFSEGTANNLTYDSSLETKVDIILQGSFLSGNNNQLKIILKQYDDSAASYIDLGFAEITANGAGRVENCTVIGTASLLRSDRIEVWVQNNTAANNITATVGTKMIINERLS